jgi:hypothetical protein
VIGLASWELLPSPGRRWRKDKAALPLFIDPHGFSVYILINARLIFFAFLSPALLEATENTKKEKRLFAEGI